MKWVVMAKQMRDRVMSNEAAAQCPKQEPRRRVQWDAIDGWIGVRPDSNDKSRKS